jgi:hypothetical protein
MQNNIKTQRGKRLTALWATMAGLEDESDVGKVTA